MSHQVATPSGELTWALITEEFDGQALEELIEPDPADCREACSIERTCSIVSLSYSYECIDSTQTDRFSTLSSNLLLKA